MILMKSKLTLKIPRIRYGAALIIEDVGLVVVVFAQINVVRQDWLLYPSRNLESTISVDTNLVAVAEKENILIFNALEKTQAPFKKIPVPGVNVDIEERIWQISIEGGIIACCTTETVKFLNKNAQNVSFENTFFTYIPY